MSSKSIEYNVQGSDSWHQLRSNRIGSSDIGTILGINPFKTKRELFLEKTGLIKPEDISGKKAVMKGVKLEPIARDLVADYHKCKYETKVFISKQNDKFIYSSDGYCEENNSIIEIKCMGLKNHEKVVSERKILEYYYPQCQWGLLVSGAEVCHFVAYSEEHAKKMVVISCERDNHLFDVMIDKASMFLKAVELKDFSIIR